MSEEIFHWGPAGDADQKGQSISVVVFLGGGIHDFVLLEYATLFIDRDVTFFSPSPPAGCNNRPV